MSGSAWRDLARRCVLAVSMPVALLVALLVTDEVRAFGDRRLVVAFGDGESPEMQRLQRLVDAERCRLVDRDVDVRFVDVGELASLTGPDGSAPTDAVPARLIELRGADAPAFELVLVGKDGGVKARAAEPEALSELLEIIDTMPMRRAEMRHAGGADTNC